MVHNNIANNIKSPFSLFFVYQINVVTDEFVPAVYSFDLADMKHKPTLTIERLY